MLCITKIDDPNIDFPALVESITKTFGAQCVLFNVPLGLGADLTGVASTLEPPENIDGAVMDIQQLRDKAIEAIVEVDDKVLEKYLEGEIPTDARLEELTRQALAEGTVTPVFCVSAKEDMGVEELLDALAVDALPPSAIPRTAKNSEGQKVDLKIDSNGPLVAQVFRTRIDPFVQKLSYIRVLSGTLHKDDTIAMPGERKGLKIGQLLQVQGEKTEAN